MEDNNIQDNFNDYVQRKKDLLEEVVFRRSVIYLMYLMIPMAFGLFLLILGIVNSDMSVIFGIILMAASIFGLGFYLKTPKIIARTNGDTITFYRRKQQPLTVKAEDIENFAQYSSRGMDGTVDFILKDSTRLRYMFVGDISNTTRRFDAWRTYQFQKQIDELKNKTLDGGYDYNDVPDGEDNKNI